MAPSGIPHYIACPVVDSGDTVAEEMIDNRICSDSSGSPVRGCSYSTVVLIAALVAASIMTFRFGWIGDDAAITFRVVDNFINGYGLRWNIAERVQPYTHPLWMLTLIPLHWFFGEAFVSTIILSALLSILALTLILTKLCKSPGQVILCSGLWMLSGAVIDYSTSGLENALAYLIVVLLVHEYCKEGPRDSVAYLSFLVSLILLTRLDLALLVLPAWLSRMNLSQGTLVRAFVGLLPLIFWEVFSLFYYGFPFPNTAYAKLGGGVAAWEMCIQGAIYLVHHIWADVVTMMILGMTMVSIACSGQKRFNPLLLGLLLYIFYVISIGGDFMQGRMLSIPCVFSISVLAIHPFFRSTQLLSGVVLGVVLVLVNRIGPGEGLAQKPGMPATVPPNGIVDERSFFFPGTGLVNANRKLPFPAHPWRASGLALRGAPQKVQVLGNVGMQGYFAGPELFIIDHFALTDPLLARLPAYRDRYWRVGHLRREIPAGYLESAKTDSNQLVDPDLKDLYDKLRIITRGELFSIQRFAEIVKMNLGWYQNSIFAPQYMFPDLKSIKLSQLSRVVPDGSPWNISGAIVLTNRTRVVVDLEGPRDIKTLTMSVDHNDIYTVGFYRGRQLIHSEQVGPRLRPGGGTSTEILNLDLSENWGKITDVQVTANSENDDASLVSLSIE